MKLKAWETEDGTEEEIEIRPVDRGIRKEKNGRLKTMWEMSSGVWSQ